MNLDDDTDEQLVLKFKRGNGKAFDVLVRRFQDRIFRLAQVSLFDQQLAADATQDVFLRSYKGLHKFRFRASVFTWLYRTTKNVCHEYNRQRTAQTLEHEPPTDTPGPEQMASQADTSAKVRTLLARLPPRQREVVILRLLEELSVRETANAMRCREGTVKALLHKAKHRLLIELKQSSDVANEENLL